MKRSTIILFPLLAWLLIACSVTEHRDSRLERDIKTEGFLDADHFQVIVRGVPDPGARGLVERRESARKNAAALLPGTALARLVNYYIAHRIESGEIGSRDEAINLSEAEAELGKKLGPYVARGHIAFEYYNEDHSAVLVFRVQGRNLAGKIEGLGVKLLRAGENKPPQK
jgi:hypothetical protein